MSPEAFEQIAAFGKQLSQTKELPEILIAIANEAKMLLRAERCSIYIVDEPNGMLWTRVSNGVGRIAITLGSGIAGLTYRSAQAQLVNDPYKHPDFLAAIDQQSGFETKNLITMPIFGSDRTVIGVMQLLNKRGGDGFTQQDKQLLTFLANYVSGMLELALKLE